MEIIGSPADSSSAPVATSPASSAIPTDVAIPTDAIGSVGTVSTEARETEQGGAERRTATRPAEAVGAEPVLEKHEEDALEFGAEEEVQVVDVARALVDPGAAPPEALARAAAEIAAGDPDRAGAMAALRRAARRWGRLARLTQGHSPPPVWAEPRARAGERDGSARVGERGIGAADIQEVVDRRLLAEYGWARPVVAAATRQDAGRARNPAAPSRPPVRAAHGARAAARQGAVLPDGGDAAVAAEQPYTALGYALDQRRSVADALGWRSGAGGQGAPPAPAPGGFPGAGRPKRLARGLDFAPAGAVPRLLASARAAVVAGLVAAALAGAIPGAAPKGRPKQGATADAAPADASAPAADAAPADVVADLADAAGPSAPAPPGLRDSLASLAALLAAAHAAAPDAVRAAPEQGAEQGAGAWRAAVFEAGRCGLAAELVRAAAGDGAAAVAESPRVAGLRAAAAAARLEAADAARLAGARARAARVLGLAAELFGAARRGQLLRAAGADSPDAALAALAPAERAAVEGRLAADAAVAEAQLAGRRCQHAALLAAVRRARTARAAGAALVRLEEFCTGLRPGGGRGAGRAPPGRGAGRRVPPGRGEGPAGLGAAGGWVECRVCHARAICGHEAMRIRLEARGAPFGEVAAALLDAFAVRGRPDRARLDGGAEQPGHFCAACGGALAPVAYATDGGDGPPPLGDTGSEARARVWGEARAAADGLVRPRQDPGPFAARLADELAGRVVRLAGSGEPADIAAAAAVLVAAYCAVQAEGGPGRPPPIAIEGAAPGARRAELLAAAAAWLAGERRRQVAPVAAGGGAALAAAVAAAAESLRGVAPLPAPDPVARLVARAVECPLVDAALAAMSACGPGGAPGPARNGGSCEATGGGTPAGKKGKAEKRKKDAAAEPGPGTAASVLWRAVGLDPAGLRARARAAAGARSALFGGVGAAVPAGGLWAAAHDPAVNLLAGLWAPPAGRAPAYAAAAARARGAEAPRADPAWVPPDPAGPPGRAVSTAAQCAPGRGWRAEPRPPAPLAALYDRAGRRHAWDTAVVLLGSARTPAAAWTGSEGTGAGEEVLMPKAGGKFPGPVVDFACSACGARLWAALLAPEPALEEATTRAYGARQGAEAVLSYFAERCPASEPEGGAHEGDPCARCGRVLAGAWPADARAAYAAKYQAAFRAARHPPSQAKAQENDATAVSMGRTDDEPRGPPGLAAYEPDYAPIARAAAEFGVPAAALAALGQTAGRRYAAVLAGEVAPPPSTPNAASIGRAAAAAGALVARAARLAAGGPGAAELAAEIAQLDESALRALPPAWPPPGWAPFEPFPSVAAGLDAARAAGIAPAALLAYGREALCRAALGLAAAGGAGPAVAAGLVRLAVREDSLLAVPDRPVPRGPRHDGHEGHEEHEGRPGEEYTDPGEFGEDVAPPRGDGLGEGDIFGLGGADYETGPNDEPA
jgi:hypothetical protein